MWVIDSILTSCYYDVSIIPYWTYEVQIVVRVAIWRGNQVQVLSDPVTVTEERLFNIPLYDSMRRGRGAMILKSGNLLCMARLNFRVKCNNHFRDSAPLGRCLLFYESRHFFMECACSYELYMIKWQAILLRMKPFPPRIYERIIFYPGVASLPLK